MQPIVLEVAETDETGRDAVGLFAGFREPSQLASDDSTIAQKVRKPGPRCTPREIKKDRV